MSAVGSPVPSPVKQALGRAAAALLPQCRFERAVFLLGHMRCGSTALSRVLCAHPEISGYGEAHVAYTHRAALGSLVLNQARRGAWRPGARLLHDKLLHNRYDRAAPPGFLQARAIFLVRPPEPAIRSIRHLFRSLGSGEYPTDALAADYYEDRLRGLAALWQAFPAERRIGFHYAELTEDPATVLARLTGFLGMATPLANDYGARGPLAPGAGDPLAAHRFTAIVAAPLATSLTSAARPPALPPSRLATLDAAFSHLTARFAAIPAAPA